MESGSELKRRPVILASSRSRPLNVLRKLGVHPTWKLKVGVGVGCYVHHGLDKMVPGRLQQCADFPQSEPLGWRLVLFDPWPMKTPPDRRGTSYLDLRRFTHY